MLKDRYNEHVSDKLLSGLENGMISYSSGNDGQINQIGEPAKETDKWRTKASAEGREESAQ